MINDAGGHEQRRLESGVVDEMKHPGHSRERRADAEQQRDQPQMADGGIGQQSLEVVLEQGDQSAQQQGGQPDPANQPGPFRRTGQGREQPRQQEHARFHHRRRMQIGRYRRRRGHGVGQPEVERELGRFGEGAEQHQRQRGQIERMGADAVAGGEDDRQFITAGDLAEQ